MEKKKHFVLINSISLAVWKNCKPKSSGIMEPCHFDRGDKVWKSVTELAVQIFRVPSHHKLRSEQNNAAEL